MIVVPLGPDAACAARALVAAAETQAPHGELVDERERQRLDRLCARPELGLEAVDPAWRPFLAMSGGEQAGYGAVLLDDRGDRATSELLVAGPYRGRGIGHALLSQLQDAASAMGARRLAVWSRDENASNVAFAEARGYTLERRLDVLRRAESRPPEPEPPAGYTIRAYAPGRDEQEVVRVLNAAFPHNPRPWTLERLEAHRSLPWVDPAGILLAVTRAGRAGGIHWTKRRSATVGEVHILGIAPDAQGTGLGRTLLRAGLVHLLDGGADEVILWMDAGNDPARRLYESEGFRYLYSDAMYGRDLP